MSKHQRADHSAQSLLPGEQFMMGDWLVSVAACTLHYSGKDGATPENGEEVKVTPRSMDVLTWLAAHPEQVVSTQQLLDNIWRSPIATDHAVHKAIAELRSALGDSAQKPRYIRTIPKRGYTLVAAIRPCASSATAPLPDAGAPPPTSANPPPPASKAADIWPRRLLATAAAVCVSVLLVWLVGDEDCTPDADTMLSLAVMPFSTQDFYDENHILAEGIRDSLVHNLSRLSHLQVTAPRLERGAAEGLNGEHPAVQRADHVLHGSVYAANGRMRVIVQLVRRADGVQEYSEQFDLPLDDIFAVQDEIATNVVDALRVHLDENERSQMRDWGTTNALAYQSFLRAEFYYSQFSPEDFHRAIDYYLAAVELDPDFINAYVGAATAANNLAVYSGMAKIGELYDLVLDMHREISRIDPGSELLESIHAIKLRMQSANYDQQEQQLRDLILAGDPPQFAIAHYALLLIGARMYDEAARLLDQLTDSSPFEVTPDEAWSYRYSVEPPPRLLAARRNQLQQRPYHIGFLGTMATNLAFLGDLRQAQVYLDQQRRVDTEGIVYHYNAAVVKFLAGELRADDGSLDAVLVDDPDYYYSNGALSFMVGDIERGMYYWSQLRPVQLRRLYNMAQVSEKLFPDRVLNSPRYHALLDALGPGIRWQRRLMEGVVAMSTVTGVDLHPASRAAYDSGQMLMRNNLWSEQDWQEFERHKAQRTASAPLREVFGSL